MVLTLLPTPIGNLGDISLRTLELLKSCDLILAEDTRKTGILLKHFEISKSMQSHHIFNEHTSLKRVIDSIKSGKSVVMVSDAGTPGISDPGYLLVRECLANGIEVDCLPGATAFVPALVMSGFPTESFVFEGFLPVKKGRQTKLKELSEEKRTIIFYESPHRIVKTLENLGEFFGLDRKVSISREISKIYQENVRGSISEILAIFANKTVKGEIVLIVEGKNIKKSK